MLRIIAVRSFRQKSYFHKKTLTSVLYQKISHADHTYFQRKSTGIMHSGYTVFRQHRITLYARIITIRLISLLSCYNFYYF